jgi:hypothetical protein
MLVALEWVIYLHNKRIMRAACALKSCGAFAFQLSITAAAWQRHQCGQPRVLSGDTRAAI